MAEDNGQRLRDLKKRIIQPGERLYKLVRPEVLKPNSMLLTDTRPKWRKGEVTDYFNYGFNELTFSLYVRKLDHQTEKYISELQQGYNPSQQFVSKLDNIPLDFGGLQIPFDPKFQMPHHDSLENIEQLFKDGLKPYYNQVAAALRIDKVHGKDFQDAIRILNLKTQEQLQSPSPPPARHPSLIKEDPMLVSDDPAPQQIDPQRQLKETKIIKNRYIRKDNSHWKSVKCRPFVQVVESQENNNGESCEVAGIKKKLKRSFSGEEKPPFIIRKLMWVRRTKK